MSGLQWFEDADLGGRNTLRLPSRADHLALAPGPDAVIEVLARAADLGLPVHVLGGGSNVVLPRRIRGVVLCLTANATTRAAAGDVCSLRVEGGADWDACVRAAAADGLWGIENLALIPGSVGAAPVQNIGAYGQEFAEVCASVEVVDLRQGRVEHWSAADCGFGYRDSRFRRARGHWLISAVELRLRTTGVPRLDYPGVAEAVAAATADGETADPECIAGAVADLRRRRLPDPERMPNAGSFFKNPVLDRGVWETLVERWPGMPGLAVGAPSADDASAARVKVPAAWLIERCGWRGRRQGGVGVSATHALVLVHHGGGDGAALLALADAIRASVRGEFGIDLEPEPVRLGWSEDDPGAQ